MYVVKIFAKICTFAKQWQVLKTIFPEVITEIFDFVDYQESLERLDYRLDERGYMSSEDYKKGTTTIQYQGRVAKKIAVK